MKKEYRTLHYLIKLFKEYGIKYIISSPGMQNSYFNAIVQQNNFFNVY